MAQRGDRVCVCVCASHPSGAGSSWSTMRFGLPVARWLTFEPPALHHALKTFPNASHERGKLISAFILSDLKKKKKGISERKDRTEQQRGRSGPEENLRLGCDVHVLARTEMRSVQRSA